MSPRASLSRIALSRLPLKPAMTKTIPSSATGEGIGFIVRPALSQTIAPVSRS
jgi:hypothetical protein